MSKKKAFSGNTMTLKDFHGGSIPSDLPLPSAPGVTDRISDRPVYDHRPLPWGVNPTGRAADQRSRLTSSSSSTRHFDDTSSFLSHAAPIGRNFDEDERKPLDGMPPGPRPTVGDDGGIWVVSEMKRHPPPQPQPPLYAAGRLSSQQQQVHDVVGSRGNSAAAWSLRKDGLSASHPVQSASAASTGASKLIYASAIEKVTSGRWHSRQQQSTHHEAEEVLNATNGYSGDEKHTGAIAVVEHRRNTSSSSSDEIHRKGKATQLVGTHFDASDEKEINAPLHIGGAFHEDIRVASTDPQYPVVALESERPKLKLLPRSKLSDQPHGGHKQQAISQVNQKPVDHPHSEFIRQVHGSAQLPAQVAVIESASQMVERPKLNLKPRSEQLKQSQGIADRDRPRVYGGGRPRELVLKERKVDEVKSRYDERPSKMNNNNNRKKSEGGGGRKVDEKRCWRNERWEEQEEERRGGPCCDEIWGKSVVEEEERGIRFGKAASAAQLAQAFSSSSRSCSVAPNKFSAQRLPFSRLIGGGGGGGAAAAAAQTSTTR